MTPKEIIAALVLECDREVDVHTREPWTHGDCGKVVGFVLEDNGADQIITALNDAGYVIAPANLVDRSPST